MNANTGESRHLGIAAWNRMKFLARFSILTATCFCILMSGTIALYPGAKLDLEFEREKIRNPKMETKQYITLDSFDKVAAFYKKLAPVAPEWTINQTAHKRLAFREKGDERNSTTIEWSTEDAADKDKTFIIVNTGK
jgi:hypothetical protein